MQANGVQMLIVGILKQMGIDQTKLQTSIDIGQQFVANLPVYLRQVDSIVKNFDARLIALETLAQEHKQQLQELKDLWTKPQA